MGKTNIQLVLERSKVRIGDPIGGYVETDREVVLKLIISVASLLPSKAKRVGPFYSVIMSYVREKRIEKSRSFEFKVPKSAPPTLSTRNFLVRWSLVVGVPRLGGRVLYPRNEIRIIAVPPLYPKREIKRVDLQSDYAEPGKKFSVIIDRRLEDPLAEVLVEEWYKDPEKEIIEVYDLDAKTEFRELGKRTLLVIDFPPLTGRTEDYIFYPLTFTTKYGSIEFGIRTKIEVSSGNLTSPLVIPFQITL
ncbi:MAG: hypothetical protein DRJ38_07930 [Thermoprotei archaeon]|nr:MAG: hypothetical protein DRJ38_07930 [Thermoprotei archaeon]